MNAASQKREGTENGRKGAAARRDLVFGLGATGLSVARFLKRQGRAARFMDSRREPPGREELAAIFPEADLILGKPSPNALRDIGRVIVSPGVADGDPLLRAARAAGVEIVSDIELFVREAKAPFVAVTGST